MSANIFPCKHCRYPLGLCDDSQLRIGLVTFYKSTQMQCPRCGFLNRWRPSVKIGLQKIERRVTTSAA